MSIPTPTDADITLEGNKLTVTIPEEQRLRLLNNLTNFNIVDANGNINIEFRLGFGEGVNVNEVVSEGGSRGREKEGEVNEPIDLQKYVDSEKEREEERDFLKFLDEGDDDGSKRSIEELTDGEKEFLVTQYIRDVPTTAIMENENVTKSALYSSLERERIPRKGKLNHIIQLLDERVHPLEVSQREDVSVNVISRIIKALEY